MAKFWKSPEFKSLENQWNTLLKESGFVDIEKEIQGERVLRQTASHPIAKSGAVEVQVENRFTYYMLLAQGLANERQFECESDWLIMELTSNGATVREISRLLKSKGMRKFNRNSICYVRRRYENRWGIRKWNPEQMVSRKPRTKS